MLMHASGPLDAFHSVLKRFRWFPLIPGLTAPNTASGGGDVWERGAAWLIDLGCSQPSCPCVVRPADRAAGHPRIEFLAWKFTGIWPISSVH